LKPTVRGTCYSLEAVGVILKSESIFRKAQRALVTARKNGPIPRDAFADNTRQIVKNFNDGERSLEDYINGGIAYFRKLPNEFKTTVPRWLDQPNYVEVWVEKDTMTASVELALKGLDVVIVPNRGWPSITFVHNNVQRLIDESYNGKNIWILYLGDLDPSGWAMNKKIKQELGILHILGESGTRATFKRIGITEEQLDKYNLRHLTNPDPKVIKKFSNPKSYYVKPLKEHFGSVFQISSGE
jgi:hypothetical protein